MRFSLLQQAKAVTVHKTRLRHPASTRKKKTR